MFLILIIFLLFSHPINAQSKPLIGVTRFDNWDSAIDPISASGDYRRFKPEDWHYRLPYFTQWDANHLPLFYGSDQSVLDQEIQFASAAGISYFNFCYYSQLDQNWLKDGQTTLNYGLRKFLSSQQPTNLKFTITIVGGAILGDKNTWSTVQVPIMVDLIKSNKYQTVFGGRPLIYIFDTTSYVSHFGSKANVKIAIDTLRQQVTQATGKNPYIIEMGSNDYNSEAIGGYLGVGTTAVGGTFKLGADAGADQWRIFLQMGFDKIEPVVTTGYDGRPRIYPGPYNTTWFQKATPAEIASQLQVAIDWTNAHPDRATGTVLIYAWNENIEGGWLVPTLYEGDARLQAISKVIQGTGFSSPRFIGRDINSDNKVDLIDYSIWKNEYLGNITTTSADFNSNSQVDLTDFTAWKSVYLKQ